MRLVTLLGGLEPDTFLKRYWQKVPLLIRGAIPGISSPISPEELAGLACEAGVESRIVQKTRRKPGWSVQHGPFSGQDFAKLPVGDWTLLVQDVDKYVPALSQLLDQFRFVPNWRIDDIMVSYAADGGGVGPHVDAYDVFLLQVQGFRRWSISTQRHEEADLPGLELKQVRNFRPQEEWLLGPGDMLYLPPGVAHDGIAVGECLTFSIGFRVPSDAEMLADLAGWLIETADKDARYSDPDLKDSSTDPGLITDAVRRRMRQRLKSLLTLEPAAFDEWFGRFITEPKPWLRVVPPRRKLSPAEAGSLLMTHELRRDAATNLCWTPESDNTLRLFADGLSFALPGSTVELARLLCREHSWARGQLKTHVRNKAALHLITDLCNAGVLRFVR
ncbi:MAG TPA: cupin domain-containing protein [Gammaproteobacteria bacterium]|nr:cupin domain-containing protein [Gammaproteobacteria bacterium]